MSTYDLAVAINELTQTARSGKTQPAQLSGGTFTITNIGVFGIDAGTPILSPGQAGILALGQITKRPWVVEDRVEPRWVTTLALSFDHRMVDGAEGSAFLSDMAEILRDPGSTLIMA
jgi:pyruvate dehydrogenase E2 component (dihydrolipoamide acetyltransferase)